MTGEWTLRLYLNCRHTICGVILLLIKVYLMNIDLTPYSKLINLQPFNTPTVYKVIWRVAVLYFLNLFSVHLISNNDCFLHIKVIAFWRMNQAWIESLGGVIELRETAPHSPRHECCVSVWVFFQCLMALLFPVWNETNKFYDHGLCAGDQSAT